MRSSRPLRMMPTATPPCGRLRVTGPLLNSSRRHGGARQGRRSFDHGFDRPGLRSRRATRWSPSSAGLAACNSPSTLSRRAGGGVARVASPRAGNSRAWTRRSPDRTTRLPRQPGHRRRRSSPRRFPTRPAARATHRSGRPTNTLTRLGRTERGSSAHYPARFVYRGNARVTISTRAIGTRWRSSVTTLSGSPGNARAPVPGGCPRSNRSGSAPTCIRQGISTE